MILKLPFTIRSGKQNVMVSVVPKDPLDIEGENLVPILQKTAELCSHPSPIGAAAVLSAALRPDGGLELSCLSLRNCSQRAAAH